MLLGGDPGIGKSTLALQACGALARAGRCRSSTSPARSRPSRCGCGPTGSGSASRGVLIVPETTAETVVEHDRRACGPAAVVVDSIQTLHTTALALGAGQRRPGARVGGAPRRARKATRTACFLIGHVTKEGSLAGPRVLEHLVDTVLYFEGDGAHALRVLRAVKNRFGSTNEVGVFEMGERGLAEVANPSAAFLAERPAGAPGSAVLATLEGSRPVLVEIQALVSRSGARDAAADGDRARRGTRGAPARDPREALRACGSTTRTCS